MFKVVILLIVAIYFTAVSAIRLKSSSAKTYPEDYLSDYDWDLYNRRYPDDVYKSPELKQKVLKSIKREFFTAAIYDAYRVGSSWDYSIKNQWKCYETSKPEDCYRDTWRNG